MLFLIVTTRTWMGCISNRSGTEGSLSPLDRCIQPDVEDPRLVCSFDLLEQLWRYAWYLGKILVTEVWVMIRLELRGSLRSLGLRGMTIIAIFRIEGIVKLL